MAKFRTAAAARAYEFTAVLLQEHPSQEPRSGLLDTLQRVKAEYEEMPGLCLTRPQAQRLWGLDEDACESVLAALVDIGYLRHTRTGYVRA